MSRRKNRRKLRRKQNQHKRNRLSLEHLDQRILLTTNPVISAPLADVSVQENSIEVAMVEASVPDADPQPALTYSVSGADANHFAIDASSGELSFSVAPDFESAGDSDGDNVYEIAVSASAPGVVTPSAALIQNATSTVVTLGGDIETPVQGGLATDGNQLYVNFGGSLHVYEFDGTFVSSHSFTEGVLNQFQNQMTFAGDSLFVRNGAALHRISTDTFQATAVNVPQDKPMLIGKNWMSGDLFSLPDGRLGMLGDDGDGSSTVRLYDVSADGNTLTWSEDISISTQGFPTDFHGAASDGTYLYVTDLANQTYRSYDLTTGGLVYTSPSNSFNTLANPTFITRDHDTGRFIVGDFHNGQVLISAEGVVAPTDVENLSITVTDIDDETLAIGGGNATSYTENAASVVVDPNLTISDDAGSTLSSATVTIENFVIGEDILEFTNQNGIVGSYDSGQLTLSGTATVEQYQNALRSVRYLNTSEAPSEVTRQISFSIDPVIPSGVVLNPENGNYYEFVSTPTTWTNAKAAAEARNVNGIPGYLATITSAQENTIAFSTSSTQQGWIGASDALQEGTWRWVTGPEGQEDEGQGLHFFNQTGVGGSPVNGQYANWGAGEPNGPNEDHAHFRTDGRWNDLPGSAPLGFFVEYGDGNGGNGGSLSVSSTVEIVPANDTPTISSAGTVDVASGTTTVLQVQANDPDNDPLSFALLQDGDYEAFNIDADTGEISFAIAPNADNASVNGDNVYELTVIAADDAAPPQFAIQQITVTVSDAPQITSNEGQDTAAVSVPENTVDVITPTATDTEDDDASLSFAITGGADQEAFALTEAGELKFVATPNFETLEITDFEVEVTVTDSTGFTDVQTITVSVADVNEAPTINVEGPTIAVSVPETQTAVTVIEAIDVDADANLEFSLTDGADLAAFTIDSETGALSFATAPDFGSPTDANQDNIYEVVVTVTDGDLTDAKNVIVTVLDAPIVTSVNAVSVPEGDTTLLELTGADAEDDAADLAFSIVAAEGSELFVLDSETNTLSFAEPPAFDAEGDNTYEVEVAVTDSDGLVGTQVVSITVLAFPAFTSEDAATVPENSTEVLQLAATDADADESDAPLAFSFAGGVDDALFEISETGQLSFKVAPNFEAAGDADGDNVYEVDVKVEDADELTTSQLLSITVTDVNDDPVILNNGGDEVVNVGIVEGSIFVTELMAMDDEDGAVGFGISGGADADKFEIDNVTGELSFKDPPSFTEPADTNLDNVYEVTVVVVDSGDPPGTDTQTLNVTVSDVPEITSPATVEAPENGTAVTTVTATDGDTPSLAFSISGGADASAFSIDENTGVLAFNDSQDFENPADSNSNGTYEVQVTVTDSAGLTDVQDMTVELTDGLDAPEITSGEGVDALALEVAENQTAVTQVTATDNDDDPNEIPLTYEIVGGVDADAFTIDAATGALAFAVAPSYESPTDNGGDNTYDVVVGVEDSDGTTDSQAISVAVLDDPTIVSSGGGDTTVIEVAEPFPLFFGGGRGDDSFFAMEFDFFFDVPLTIVEATDTEDDPAELPLSYSIVGGADQAMFDINEDGELRFGEGVPHYEDFADANDDNVFEVSVQVADSDGQTDTQTISIQLLDAPVITGGSEEPTTFQVPENSMAIATIAATDIEDDLDSEASITYSIFDPYGLMFGGGEEEYYEDDYYVSIDINEETGELFFDGTPDFEYPMGTVGAGEEEEYTNTYEVTVVAEDSDGLLDVQIVHVEVTDVNEAPIIVSPSEDDTGDVEVGEGRQAVTTVEAFDEDDYLAGIPVTYSLIDGGDSAAFSIDEETGELTFNAPPSYDNPIDSNGDNQYEVTVAALDSNPVTLVDAQVITVTVTDSPEITSDGGGESAPINAAENQTAVTTVTATDIEDDAAGMPLSYGIVGGTDANAFLIDAATGELTFNGAPDFETATDDEEDGVYEVNVAVSDSIGLVDVQSLSVTVTDVNDSPEFSEDSYVANVAEGDSSVTVVTASDVEDDASEVDDVTYSITGGADAAAFSIDGASGEISFDPAPDFENPADAGADNTYEIEVTVTDSEGATDVVPVTVNVSNVEENPEITSHPDEVLEFEVAEESTAEITQFAASDDEDGDDLPNSGLLGQYFDNIDFTNLAMERVDENVNFDWGGGSPSSELGPETFSVRWTGQVQPEFSETYTFTTTTDDGVRLWVNNELIIDKYFDQGATAHSGEIALDAGVLYDIRMEYYEHGGGAVAILQWASPSQTAEVIPSSQLYDSPHVRFSLTGPDASAFSVEPESGELTFTASSHESLSDSNDDNVFEATLTATDSNGQTDSRAIQVTVTDAPEIISGNGDTAEATVVEGDTQVATVAASDVEDDADEEAAVSFSLEESGDHAAFTIDSETGALSFVTAPDFENSTAVGGGNTYQVTVIATDSDGQTDSQTISIEVTDINDAPIITSDGGADTASVNATEGSTVATIVQATDAEDDANGVGLSYNLLTGPDLNAFNINAQTGELTFIEVPTFENPADADGDNKYVVTVSVLDSEDVFDTQLITINVTDGPIITSDGGAETAEVVVDENQVAVTQVIATDTEDDATDPATALTYEITGGADAAAFLLSADGTLTFADAPNFESPTDAGSDNIYEVEVTVTDSDELAISQTLSVEVKGVNDDPVFTSDHSEGVEVTENTTAVATIAATDEEDGSNLTYQIVGGIDAGSFNLDPESGELTFNVATEVAPEDVAPNFEDPQDDDSNNTYIVEVAAVDGDEASVTQEIVVTVANESEVPVIVSGEAGDTAAVVAVENQTFVTTLEATDEEDDLAEVALAFTIDSGDDAAMFQIVDGDLHFISEPDFETAGDAGMDNTYEVNVTVTDADNNTDTQAISVTVNNVNEDPTFDSESDVVVEAVENSEGIATELPVSDPEDGTNVPLTITGGDDAALFAISEETGELTLTITPDFEAPQDADLDNTYEVEVTATDQGELTDVQNVTVVVSNEAEAPEITSGEGAETIEIGVDENSTEPITAITAADPEEAILSFSLGGSDAGAFTISETGELAFAATPDFEMPLDSDLDNLYEVEVTVTDGDELTDTQQILVTVNNVNEAPTFDEALVEVNVAEMETDVATASAEDSEPGALVYSISSGDDADKFEIDSASGVISFAQPPNYEMPLDANADNEYVFAVSATDAGEAVGIQTYVVTVTDEAEAPAITSDNGADSASIEIFENQTEVRNITAFDEDTGSELNLSITGGADESAFNINEDGLLEFVEVPNFESPTDIGGENTYELEVSVDDGTGLSDSQSLFITVLDTNDKPTITSSASATVSEGSTTVSTVTAEDEDDTEFTYSITGGEDGQAFSIDPDSGVLSFVEAPDFEMPGDTDADNEYWVEVTVRDAGLQAASQAMAVTVTSVPEPPQIEAGDTAFEVSEGEVAVSVFTATDPEDDDSTLVWSLSGDDATHFAIAEDGSLSFVTAPDFETPLDADADNVYSLDVTVTDSSGATDSQSITVTVSNVNEAPTVTSDVLFAAAENQQQVGTMTASDPDADSALLWSITGGNDAAAFAIDETTGELSLAAPQDFEALEDSTLEVEVTVTDEGELTASQLVTVAITDVLEPPTLEESTTEFLVPEGETAVTAFVATDPEDDDSTLDWSLAGDDAALFQIDTDGVLSFVAAPDFEVPLDGDADNTYLLDVVVTDADGGTDSRSVSVIVTDVNEAPTVTSPAEFAAAENQQQVGTMTASNPDADSALLWSITGGNDAAAFAIDETTGELSLAAPQDFEALEDSTLEVEVTVTDDGDLTGSQLVTVAITDVSEAPQIEGEVTEFEVE